MANRLTHPRRAVRIHAEVADLAILVHNSRAAFRTMRRHLELFRAWSRFLGDPNHVWNYVASALDQHGIVRAEILAADFIEVVQRGISDRHARKLHRAEFRNRRQRSNPAYLHLDSFDHRFSLLRFELVRDGPARRARDLAELLLERIRVYLSDHAVSFVVETMAFL